MNGKSDKKSLFEYCPTVVTLLKINFLLYSLLFVIQWISTRGKSFSISKSKLSTVIVFCDLREDVASLWRPRTLSSTWPAASRPPPGSGTGQAGGEKQRFNVDIETEISLYIFTDFCYWYNLLAPPEFICSISVSSRFSRQYFPGFSHHSRTVELISWDSISNTGSLFAGMLTDWFGISRKPEARPFLNFIMGVCGLTWDSWARSRNTSWNSNSGSTLDWSQNVPDSVGHSSPASSLQLRRLNLNLTRRKRCLSQMSWRKSHHLQYDQY